VRGVVVSPRPCRSGAVWNWDAATSVEGDDADYCPEPGPDWRNPKMEQFRSN
jgi:hypothetical protein